MSDLRVFTGKIRQLSGGVSSAISKEEVHGDLWLGPEGLEGDVQADTKNHGGADRALHHYPAQHYVWWQETLPVQRDRFVIPAFGENLSISGWDEENVHIGDVFRWGDALIQVSQPRAPCHKLDRHLACSGLALLMQQSGRCGWLCRVLEPGMVGASRPFTLAQRGSSISVRETMQIVYGQASSPEELNASITDWHRLQMAEGLSERWKAMMQQRIDSGKIETWQMRLEGPAG